MANAIKKLGHPDQKRKKKKICVKQNERIRIIMEEQVKSDYLYKGLKALSYTNTCE
jgi:hypothetical protein